MYFIFRLYAYTVKCTVKSIFHNLKSAYSQIYSQYALSIKDNLTKLNYKLFF